ncbi:cytochrome c biogenesis protein CcmE [Wolbachia pipientis]|uniref:Cytochrome c biogenesis protein CcmE n=1 Tax=Wolbachia pipientis TaxID=955 RepID=A0A1E7QKV1_WOLPI|nr:cytochrome c maturation protein CcmE [Wolbachia pipientis]OEY87105.1 cytochrome c biogenesis protein CcmE [Wolbachia pipientis]
MKKRHKRLLVVTGIFCALSCIIFFVLMTLKENISFFYTVSEAVMLPHKKKPIRICGIVVENSIIKNDSEIIFQITDFNQSISIVYKGILPPMFSEKNSVVVQGIMLNKTTFLADTVFAKHDENYMSIKAQ